MMTTGQTYLDTRVHWQMQVPTVTNATRPNGMMNSLNNFCATNQHSLLSPVGLDKLTLVDSWRYYVC